MKTIRQAYYIHASIQKVWQALVDPKDIEGWGAGPAKMDEKVGTEFSLWDGEVWGKNIKVTPNKKLVQEWYGGKWDKPSIARFSLHKEEDGVTRIDFLHENVPDSEAKDIEQGWKDYYLGPLKRYVEEKQD